MFGNGTPPSPGPVRSTRVKSRVNLAAMPENRPHPMYARAVELLERFGAVSVEHPSGTLLTSICAGPTSSSTDGGAARTCVGRASTTACTGRRNSRKRTVPLEARDAGSRKQSGNRLRRSPISTASLIATIALSKPRRGRPLHSQDTGRRGYPAQPGAARRPDGPGSREPPGAAASNEARRRVDEAPTRDLRASRAAASRRRCGGVSGHVSPSQQGGDLREEAHEPPAASASVNHEAVEAEAIATRARPGDRGSTPRFRTV